MSNFNRFRNDDGTDTQCHNSSANCNYTGCFWIATNANPSDNDCVNCLVNQSSGGGTGGNKYCNMCHDRECSLCTTYKDDGCTTCGLKFAENDTDNAGECRCTDGYDREDTDSSETLDWCAPCHNGCGACTNPSTYPNSFEKCSRCLDSKK